MKRFGFSLVLLFCSVVAMAQSIRPEPGMWYNPDRSGHGFDLNFYGQDTLAIVWYTYDQQGMPIWYQAAAAYGSNTWQADLYQYSWNGSTATPVVVGSIRLEVSDPRHASLNWTIDYGNGPVSGSEPVELLIVDPAIPQEIYSGHWYDTSEPGWGMTIGNQGDIEFVVLYFYDDAGQPTWALGASDLGTAKSVASHDMLSYRGFCPGCAYTPPDNEVIGSLTRDFTSAQQGTVSYNMVLGNGLSGQFARSNSQVQMASDPVDTENLVHKRMEFLMSLGAFDSVFGAAQGVANEGLALGSAFNTGNCPTVTTENGGATMILDWGESCTGTDGTEYSGKLTIDVQNYVATLSSVTGILAFAWDEYSEDGEMLLDGVLWVENHLTGNNAGVYDGSFLIEAESLYSYGTYMDGSMEMQINGLDTSSTEYATSFDSMVYVFNGFNVDGFILQGSLTIEPEVPESGEYLRMTITMDLQSSAGPVQGEILVIQETETRSVWNTVQSTTVGTATFEMRNVVYDSALCEDYPISGSMTWIDNGIPFTVTFDGSCSLPSPSIGK